MRTGERFPIDQTLLSGRPTVLVVVMAGAKHLASNQTHNDSLTRTIAISHSRMVIAPIAEARAVLGINVIDMKLGYRQFATYKIGFRFTTWCITTVQLESTTNRGFDRPSHSHVPPASRNSPRLSISCGPRHAKAP
jgi:hypothetical protein